MEFFTNVMNQLNSIVWALPLVVLCLGAGIWFSIRMKFPQVRLFKEMVKLLVHGEKSDAGITPFQAFAATVGSRVGMGNIAGVATAIFFGGPGTVFWMWIIAFIGASSAFMESALAQAYKVKGGNGEYLGGPAYFIERALKCKPYAIAFAVATILGPGILMPGLHVNSIASTYEEAFGANMLLVGIIFCAIFGLVICGGIKRIAKTAEYMAPIMCVVYVVMAFAIIIIRIKDVPAVFKLIVTSAFGLDPLFGGIVGSAISWGVKRGIYSNEAGQGSGAIVIIMFVFTLLMGYYYQAESNVRYLFKDNKKAVWVMRAVFLFSAFSGVLVNGEIIWPMGDTGAGMMAWLNIIAILLLSKKGFALLKDYEEQRKAGKDPVFDPKKFDIEDTTGVWSKFKNK